MDVPGRPPRSASDVPGRPPLVRPMCVRADWAGVMMGPVVPRDYTSIRIRQFPIRDWPLQNDSNTLVLEHPVVLLGDKGSQWKQRFTMEGGGGNIAGAGNTTISP